MLRKRTRSSNHKDHHMGRLIVSDNNTSESYPQLCVGYSPKSLFVGYSPRALFSDSDSVQSPTSPLDFRPISNFRSHPNVPQKVGLSIIDSLDHDDPKNPGDFRSSHSKNVIFGSKVRFESRNSGIHLDDFGKPKSMRMNFGVFPCEKVKLPYTQIGSGDFLFGSRENPMESDLLGKIRSFSLDSERFWTADFKTHSDNFGKSKSCFGNHGSCPQTQIHFSNTQMRNSDSLFGNRENQMEFEPFGKVQSFPQSSGRLSPPNSLIHLNKFEKPESHPGNYSFFPNTQMGNSRSPFGDRENSIESNDPFEKTHCFSLDSAALGPPLTTSTAPNNSSNSGILCPEIRNSNRNNPISGISNPKSFSASEIELSEDYTCVVLHGPNPKITHIYGDCILECHTNELTNSNNKLEEEIEFPRGTEFKRIATSPFPSNDFLSICYYCKKKLEGKDIYMYRGEKAFCSCECRSEGIKLEEEMEKPLSDFTETSPKSSGMFIAT